MRYYKFITHDFPLTYNEIYSWWKVVDFKCRKCGIIATNGNDNYTCDEWIVKNIIE